MGKRRLITGIVSGAIIGGIISLFNADARTYARKKLSDTRDVTAHVVNNPTETVRSLKQSVEQLNNRVATESTNALNALEQIEDTLDKVTKRIN